MTAKLTATEITIGETAYRVERPTRERFVFVKLAEPVHFGYNVLPSLEMCSCPDRKYRNRPCKHLRAVESLRLEEFMAESPAAVEPVAPALDPFARAAAEDALKAKVA
jgi:hypothetical protein